MKTSLRSSSLYRHFLFLNDDQISNLQLGKFYNYTVNNQQYIIIDSSDIKLCCSDNYNFIFNKQTGLFKRWGNSYKDDPTFSPVGPEILDIEISVNGCPNACSFCYKNNNNSTAINMSFETFKSIIDKFPKTLTQVAFGITGIKTNPDFIKMMEYCREIGVIPNFTLSGIDLDNTMAEKCAKLVGALAVSAYQKNKNVCYDTVQKFINLGVKQTNIHLMASKQTKDFVYEVLNDKLNDPRLANVNAIVFLCVKPKGRAKSYSPLSDEEYGDLINFCFKNNIPFGFDSCSAGKFQKSVTNNNKLTEGEKANLIQLSESCESSLFSSYINVAGEYWHCSFSENEPNQECANMLEINNFLGDLWYSNCVSKFRNALLNSNRNCNIYAL